MNSFLRCLALSTATAMVVGQCSSFPSGMDQNIAAVDNTGFSSCHGQLRLGGANNVQIVGENGELVQLMGISSHGLQWFPQCYTKESIQFLVENWGINLFRAAMYITEGGYSDGTPEVLDLVKNIVQWTKELGIYVIIDWHMLSPGDPNAPEYSRAPSFWSEISALYKDEKHVIYEICNEPNNVDWATIKQYADRIIPIIRSHDDDALIIVGTTDWSQGVDQVSANPVAFPSNVMYTFHFYSGSHMFLYDRINTESTNVPIFATEWGVSEASGTGGPYLDNAKQFLDLFIERNIAFSMWSYADKDEVSAALMEDACGSGSWDSVSCSGLFLKTYIKSHANVCSAAAPLPVTPIPVQTPQPAPATPTPVQTPQPTAVPVPTPQPASCVAETLSCDGSSPCCSGGCYRLSSAAPDHMCMAVCSAPWDCSVFGSAPVPSTPTGKCVADTYFCDGSQPCCNGDCRRLSADAPEHMCMASCSSPWDCSLLGQETPSPPVMAPTPAPSTPAPRTPPPATPQPPVPTPSPPSGTCVEWSSCTQDLNCCVSGTLCMVQSVYYAQCRKDCPAGWACAAAATPAVPAQCGTNVVGAWGNCMTNPCCETGYTCYEQNIYYAQCKQGCDMVGWTCNVLSP